MKARTAAANQLHSLSDTAPDAVRASSSAFRSSACRHRGAVATR